MRMLTIEKATADDAALINSLLFETWLATYPNAEIGVTEEDIREHFRKSFTREGIEKRKAAYANPPENEYRIVAKEDGVLVGVARGVQHVDHDQLQMLYVHPQHQRKGVGMALWNELQKFFRNDREILVQVATYNTKAIAFYEKLGFRDTGRRFSEERHRMPISGVAIPEMEMMRKA